MDIPTKWKIQPNFGNIFTEANILSQIGDRNNISLSAALTLNFISFIYIFNTCMELYNNEYGRQKCIAHSLFKMYAGFTSNL